MKNLIKLTFIFTIIISLIVLIKLNKESKVDICFDNIEALASGEGDGKVCYSEGSMECDGKKVDRYIWVR